MNKIEMSSRSSRQSERLLNLFDNANEKIKDSDTPFRPGLNLQIIMEHNTFNSPPNPKFDYAQQKQLEKIQKNIENTLSGRGSMSSRQWENTQIEKWRTLVNTGKYQVVQYKTWISSIKHDIIELETRLKYLSPSEHDFDKKKKDLEYHLQQQKEKLIQVSANAKATEEEFKEKCKELEYWSGQPQSHHFLEYYSKQPYFNT